MHLYRFLEQRGSGTGIESIEERDREAAVKQSGSKLLDYPEDMECISLLRIFNNTPFEVGHSGVSGLKYEALKDQIRWAGLKPKEYVNKLLTCVNYYIKGSNMKKL